MSNVVKQEALLHVAHYGDGFDDDPGFEVSSGGNLFAGKTRISFDGTKPNMWFVSASKAPMPKGLELIVKEKVRLATRWGKEPLSGPVEQHVLAPGEAWPDFEARNKAIDQSEWRTGFNGLVGPWEGQVLISFVDEKTLDQYVWASSTKTSGSMTCVREFSENLNWMRAYRGEYLKAVIELGDVFMPTQWGGRQRPHLIIKRWVRFNDGGNRLALSESDNSALVANSNQPAQQPVNDNSMQTVEEPSLREVTKDEIPY